jgi:acyl-[acyl-carrier-protein] desaturase
MRLISMNIERNTIAQIDNNLHVVSPPMEVIPSMEGFVEEHLGSLLVKAEDSWQPSDFLLDMTSEQCKDQLIDFRTHTQTLPDDLLAVLAGDMVTEVALPTYQTWFNRLQGVTDTTGA